MDIFYYFLIAGAAIVILILQFDKKQTARLNTVLKEAKSTPPLFLLRATEQKISTLKRILQSKHNTINMAVVSSENVLNHVSDENIKDLTLQRLKILSARYNNGQITIEAYNSKLDDLLDQITGHHDIYAMAY